MKRQENRSPMRSALQGLWELNIKSMPSAIVWAGSFWFVIETHSLLIRSIAILVCSLAAFASALVVVRGRGIFRRALWDVTLHDASMWKMLLASGLLVDLSLENLAITHLKNSYEKTLFLSIFLSSLIIWLFFLLVVIPFRIEGRSREKLAITSLRALQYVRHEMKYFLLSLAVMLLAWPIFFFYMFLALTFAQCLTLSASEEFARESMNTRNGGMQIA